MSRLLEQDRRAYLAALGIPVWGRRIQMPAAGPINLGQFVTDRQPVDQDASRALASHGLASHGLTVPTAEFIAQAGDAAQQSIIAGSGVSSILNSGNASPPDSGLTHQAPAAHTQIRGPGPELSNATTLAGANSQPLRLSEQLVLGAQAQNMALPDEVLVPGFATDDRPELRFWFHHHESLLLIDDCPKVLNQQQRERLLQLATNILSVCRGVTAQSQLIQQLDWPVFPNPMVDQCSQKALEYVRHKLLQYLQQYKPERVLLAGERAQSYFLRSQEVELWQQGRLMDVPVLAIPSLSQLLAMPDFKAELWQQWQSWTIKHER